MSGFVLLIAVVAIVAVVAWSIVNDAVPTGARTHWLLAMRDDDDAASGDTDAGRRTPLGPRLLRWRRLRR